jgi:hypothetical protein
VRPRLKDMGQGKGNKRKKLRKIIIIIMGRKGYYAFLLFMVKSIIAQSKS